MQTENNYGKQKTITSNYHRSMGTLKAEAFVSFFNVSQYEIFGLKHKN